MARNHFFIKGIYRDRLIGADGRIVFDSGWRSNTIVDRGRMLLAAFMKGDGANGIQYLAVGSGDPNWDNNGAPAPDTATTDGLVARYTGDPIPPEGTFEMVYLDENEDPVTDGSVTTRLQITATLTSGYPAPGSDADTFPLREFGLFGRLNGSDYLINVIRHPVIHKDKDSTLIRVIRLFF